MAHIDHRSRHVDCYDRRRAPHYPNLGVSLAELYGDSIPSFRYASGDVSIEDRSEADTREGRPVLRRTLRFSAPLGEPLFFRVLTGEFETLSAREVRTPRLLLTLPDVPTVLRSSAGDDRPAELLLRLPAGSSSVTIDYELLD